MFRFRGKSGMVIALDHVEFGPSRSQFKT